MRVWESDPPEIEEGLPSWSVVFRGETGLRLTLVHLGGAGNGSVPSYSLLEELPSKQAR